MSTSVSNLLSYASLGAASKREDVTLADVLTQSIEELDPSISKTQTILHVADLPTLRGDATKLRCYLENLITNAIKYVTSDVTPQISVYTEYVECLVEKGVVCVEPRTGKRGAIFCVSGCRNQRCLT